MSLSIPSNISRDEIKLLVDSFYKQAMADDMIGIYFTQVIQLDLVEHMPIMYDFWDSTLNGTGAYKGNPMTKHILLHKKHAFKTHHFDRWLELWEDNARTIFDEKKSKLVIEKAHQIAQLMQFKVLSDNPHQLNIQGK